MGRNYKFSVEFNKARDKFRVTLPEGKAEWQPLTAENVANVTQQLTNYRLAAHLTNLPAHVEQSITPALRSVIFGCLGFKCDTWGRVEIDNYNSRQTPIGILLKKEIQEMSAEVLREVDITALMTPKTMEKIRELLTLELDQGLEYEYRKRLKERIELTADEMVDIMLSDSKMSKEEKDERQASIDLEEARLTYERLKAQFEGNE